MAEPQALKEVLEGLANASVANKKGGDDDSEERTPSGTRSRCRG